MGISGLPAPKPSPLLPVGLLSSLTRPHAAHIHSMRAPRERLEKRRGGQETGQTPRGRDRHPVWVHWDRGAQKRPRGHAYPVFCVSSSGPRVNPASPNTCCVILGKLPHFSEKDASGSVSRSVVLTLCGPMDCSPPCSSVHGILQARMLEWGAISFSKRAIIISSCDC